MRCIKPNEEKSPTQFNYERCQHQAMYLGLLENVRVRRAGFAFRMHYTRFLQRSRSIVHPSVRLSSVCPTSAICYSCLDINHL